MVLATLRGGLFCFDWGVRVAKLAGFEGGFVAGEDARAGEFGFDVDDFDRGDHSFRTPTKGVTGVGVFDRRAEKVDFVLHAGLDVSVRAAVD